MINLLRGRRSFLKQDLTMKLSAAVLKSGSAFLVSIIGLLCGGFDWRGKR
ncbi:hypothetical protein BofuT4_P014900.1 [Botrytis cinerea T4]|uniref:Uncharacterized protein n=1 Tax=Botryotinia fuckeliana (strain T4) TaxID=999810 RepID=G2XNA6_BOTF4|nr:hypothetical protein BofuT4_P014900.1 [Botrytis cinerea T4]